MNNDSIPKTKNIDRITINNFCLDVIDMVNDQFSIDQVYEKEEIFDWVNENSEPEDVFDDNKLDKWAKSHGYKYESNTI